MRSNCVIQTSSDALGRLCVRDYGLSWVFPYVLLFQSSPKFSRTEKCHYENTPIQIY